MQNQAVCTGKVLSGRVTCNADVEAKSTYAELATKLKCLLFVGPRRIKTDCVDITDRFIIVLSCSFGLCASSTSKRYKITFRKLSSAFVMRQTVKV